MDKRLMWNTKRWAKLARERCDKFMVFRGDVETCHDHGGPEDWCLPCLANYVVTEAMAELRPAH